MNMACPSSTDAADRPARPGADRPVLIIHTGDPDETTRQAFGGYGELMRVAAGLAPHEVDIVPVYLGEQPGAPQGYRAAFITGSPAMVTDREPWSEQSAAWLRDAASAGLPMFGVCYGHQLLAHALGGDVGYNPAGREIGTHPVECIAADPLLDGLPRRFDAQMMHMQSVMRPPPGAVTLARSPLDPHQILRMGEGVYSVQFHPEFPVALMRDNLRRYRERYASENLDVAALLDELRPTPEPSGLLRRFLERHAALRPALA